MKIPLIRERCQKLAVIRTFIFTMFIVLNYFFIKMKILTCNKAAERLLYKDISQIR